LATFFFEIFFLFFFGQNEQDHEKLSGYVVFKLKFKESSFRMKVTTAKSNLLYGSSFSGAKKPGRDADPLS